MRKGLLSSVATALVGAGSALAQNPYYLPSDAPAQAGGVPALLSADQTAPAAPAQQAAPPRMDCGSTGLVSGVDCLPQSSGPQRPQFYGDVSYMIMSVKDAPAAGPLAFIALNRNQPFGPGSIAALGGDDTSFDGMNGFRGTVGMWLGCDRKIGIEGGGFWVEQANDTATLTSNGAAGNPLIIRPFLNLNAVPPAVGGLVVAAPGIPGSITERQSVKIWGYEANGVLHWRDDCHRSTDLLAGFTYTDLHETLGVTSSTTTPGVNTTVLDDAIGTRNQFYAPQVGTRTTWTFGQFDLTMVGKVAAGVNHESVDRFGNTTTIGANGVVVNTPSAFLVQASNRGRVTTDKFCVGTPSQIMLNYHVTCNLSAYVGYDFIYLTSAVRPGNHVDLALQNVGAAQIRPAGGINQTDFWANSFLAGLSWKF